MRPLRILAASSALAALAGPLTAQSVPPDVAREREAYAEWLASAPNSPLAAIAQQPIGSGLRLGPGEADVPLDGLAEHRVRERGGVVTLEGPDGPRPLPPGRPLPLGSYFVSAAGAPGRRVLTVFGPSRTGKAAEYYPYDSALVFTGPLMPPERRETVRVLAPDGVEVEAAEAGTVTLPLGGRRVRLVVRRIPTGRDESELEIYFRDGTNGEGTYPAGRFVTLIPIPDGPYRLDFNRARNPYCAYSSAFPCPAPWRGNTIETKVEAGERYAGGGLSAPPIGLEAR